MIQPPDVAKALFEELGEACHDTTWGGLRKDQDFLLWLIGKAVLFLLERALLDTPFPALYQFKPPNKEEDEP